MASSSSRIIVKNLPKKYKEARLRELFGEHGNITQIKYFPQRKFAYVGFVDEKAAKSAAEYRDGTFVDTSKIQVSLALGIGDQRLPRPWSRYSKGSSANDMLKKKREQILNRAAGKKKEEEKAQQREEHEARASKTLSKLEKEQAMLKKLYDVEANPNVDPELHEYMQLMVPKSQRLVWTNDGGQHDGKRRASPATAAADAEADAVAGGDDADDDGGQKKGGIKATLETVGSKRPGGKDVTYVRQHLQFEDSDDSDDDEYEDAPGADTAGAGKGDGEGKKKRKKKGEEGEEADAESEEQDSSEDSDSGSSSSSEEEDDDLSDSEWLKSKMKRTADNARDGEAEAAKAASDKMDEGSDDSEGQETKDDEAGANKKKSKKQKKKKQKKKKDGKSQLFESDSEDDDSTDDEADKEGKKGGSNDAGRKTITIYTTKVRGLPFKAKEPEIRSFFSPIDVLEMRILKDVRKRSKGVAFVDFGSKKDYKAALKKDRQHLGKRFIEVMPSDTKKIPALRPEDAAPSKLYPAPLGEDDEGMEESGRLFVRNLAYACTEDDIHKLFQNFGELAEVHMPLDTETKKPKGFAFVAFLTPENALKAFTKLDGKVFMGRLLHVLPARTRENDTGITDAEPAGYKDKKEAELKSKRESSYNWNTLFMRQDAVADSMAAELGMSKGELLNAKDDSNLAVRLAMGETKIIQENKQFLRDHGVLLDAFDTRVTGRSKTVILAKNLPFNSDERELKPMFQKHGAVDKFVLPPSRTMALVSFIEPTEAKAAFKALAYRKYKGEMLYLEWAPENVFAGKEAADAASADAGGADEEDDVGHRISQEKLRGAHGGEGEVAPELDAESSVTVFVKNLNFETHDDALYNLFESCGTIRSCRVATRPNPHNAQEPLSMGFGFVEFKTHAEAIKAMKQLQGAELDGHKLELKLSTRKANPKGPAARREGGVTKATTNKLVVRNVAFEATKKEIRQLFTPYGDVKSVRLPPKAFDPSQHRGFAFVEFSTKEEAKTAFEALSGSTHLYGRRLNLEFAKEDTSLEKLKSRARSALKAVSDQPSKKAKIDLQ